MKRDTVKETARTLRRLDVDDDTVKKIIHRLEAALSADTSTSDLAAQRIISGVRSMNHNSTHGLRHRLQSSLADIQGHCGVKFQDDFDNINGNNNRKQRSRESSGVDEYDWEVRRICRRENFTKNLNETFAESVIKFELVYFADVDES